MNGKSQFWKPGTPAPPKPTQTNEINTSKTSQEKKPLLSQSVMSMKVSERERKREREKSLFSSLSIFFKFLS